MNAISLGEFDRIKSSLNYDYMYHLYTLFKLSDDTVIRLEKNQVINIAIEPTYEIEDSEYTRVYDFGIYASELFIRHTRRGNNNKNIFTDVFTLSDAIDKTYEAFPAVSGLPQSSYWEYSGYNNNCQVFTLALLSGIGRADSPGIRDFVLQDTKKIIGGLNNIAQGIIQSATDIAAVVDMYLNGA